MKIENKIINGINTIYIKTDKFKSVCGTLYFKSILDNKKASALILLSKVLNNSCKKYNTKEKLRLESLKNYNTSYSYECNRYGKYILNSFSFNCINDKFINDNVISKAIDIFKEIIFNPNINDGAFNKEDYDICYKKLKTSLETIKEDPRSYGNKKIRIMLDEELPYSIFPEVKELEKLNNKELYNIYLDMINNSDVTLILVGDFNFDKVADEITKNLKSKSCSDSNYIENKVNKSSLMEIEESLNTSGSVFFLGMKCFDLTLEERIYIVPLYSLILGGGATSRLFNVVREENSLAYYCSSAYNKDDSIIRVIGGIDKANYSKTKQLVIKVIESMNKVSDDELKRAKEEIVSSLKSTTDYPQGLCDLNYYRTFYNEPDIEERINNFNKVTKEDIMRVNEKIKMDCIFFLKGDK